MKYNDTTKIKHLINNFIKKYKINNILIAISGGQDSVYLVKTFQQLVKEKSKKIRVSYIYIDHQWKNSCSQQVEHIINYVKTIHASINIYQIKELTLSEDICRKQRYHIITEHAIKYNYNLIITGHNKTDIIETFIHNVSKGSTIETLTNLSIRSQISQNKFILRPLIILNRHNIYWMCKKICLPIWSDNTNYRYNIQRNRIRQELIPYMRKYLHINIEKNIKYLLNDYYYENEYLKQNAIKLYLTNMHNDKLAINYEIIAQQNIIVQIKILQIFCFHNLQIYLENKKITKILLNFSASKIYIQKNVENKHFRFIISNKWLYIIMKK